MATPPSACGAARRFYHAFYIFNHPCIEPVLLRSSAALPRRYSRNGLKQMNRQLSTSKPLSAHPTDTKAQSSAPTGGEAPISLSDHVRQIMRYVPQPVTIITATAPLQSSIEAGSSAKTSPIESAFRGMTVSSFNTVTLSPTPIVSFNVKVPSATHSAITQSGTFLVHLMKSSSTGAKIADAFARGGNTKGEVFEQLATNGGDVKIFAGRGTQGAPLIVGDGIYRVLRCRMLPEKEVKVEDHVILIGEVLSVFERHDIGQSRVDPEKELGLVYVDRTFRYAGEVISAHVESDQSTGSSELDSSEPEPFQRTLGLNVRRGDEGNAA